MRHLAALAVVLLTPTAAAQSPFRHETRNGVLEIHGLRRWTLQAIEDSLARYAPGETLEAPTCAATLTQRLGFSSVEVARIGVDSLTGHKLTVITVVEPGQSAAIGTRSSFATRQPTDARFRDFAMLMFKGNGQAALQSMAQLYDTTGSVGSMQNTDTRALGTLLREHATPDFHALARTTLLTDGNDTNRVGAAMALAGSFGNDSTYWTLADGLRDGNGVVTITAGLALHALASHEQRRVDWAPARESLLRIFSGAGIFQHQFVRAALLASQIDTTLARDVTAPGEDLLLSQLSSQSTHKRASARSYLGYLVGRDLGEHPTAWKQWFQSRRYGSTLR